MTRYLARRLLTAVPLLIGISALLFILMNQVPGGPLAVYGANPHMHAADRARLIHAMGLDLPIHMRYFKWLLAAVQGDLGHSIFTGRPVLEMIAERTPNTLVLMGLSTVVSLVVGIALGVYSAIKPYSKFDYAATTASFLGYSLPTFWFGIMLMMVFAAKLHWLPAGGMHSLGQEGNWVDGLSYLVLPVTVLSIVSVASWSRFMRSSMLEVLRADFIRTARAKGQTERVVIGYHALRNALLPVVTVVMMAMPGLFGGAVMTETIFAWPGIGRLFYDSMGKSDYPVMMGVLMISAVLVVVFNLLADVLYSVVDPRIQME
ncbi:MAG TPA: ABC transporter permease [Stenomitos sp.]